jgi:uncharacterized protein
MNATTMRRTDASFENFTDLLTALAKAEAFPFAVAAGEPHVIQTHASAILLAQNRAYKVKKPRDFGFFDFSTPSLRRKYCILEVALNARLAPSVYLGIAPVIAMPDGRVLFGRTLPAHLAPQPGTAMDGGTVVDFAVVMVRLPEDATLQSRVAAGTADAPLVRRVARQVAAFHGRARTDEHIASFGSIGVIRQNWDENLEQMKPFVGRLLDQDAFAAIEAFVDAFMCNRAALLQSRVSDGHIRDCHGDLRLQHVYALGAEPDPGSHLAIIDCIEFNERFRYGDVASEVAFFVMELEAEGRLDLAHVFLDTYLQETGDEALRELLPFYMCYRACVRGKVQAFQLGEPEVPSGQREEAERQARRLFALARQYAGGRTRPALVMVGGTMGTGKSSLAARLHQALGWPLASSDLVRKRLARIDPQEPVAEPFGRGIYSEEWTQRTYGMLLDMARATLVAGRSVLIDATYGRRAFRAAATALAGEYGAQAVLVECLVAPEVAKARLARRWQTRTNRPPGATATTDRDASDGRPALFDAQQAAWETYDTHTDAELAHVVVSTASTQAEAAAQAIRELGAALHCELALEAAIPEVRPPRDRPASAQTGAGKHQTLR